MTETCLLTLTAPEQRALVDVLRKELLRSTRQSQPQLNAVIAGVIRKLTAADEAAHPMP